MSVMPWVGFAIGVVVVPATMLSMVSALLLPRLATSRVARLGSRITLGAFIAVARRMRTYEAADRLLAFQAPLQLFVLLAFWVALLVSGYALLLWPFSGNLLHAFVISGSSLTTLGIASQAGAAPHLLVFLTALTGLVVIALLIAYLPVIYASVNRRETLVTVLEGRGGRPAWGPEVLARHCLIDLVHDLGRVYGRWEEWAADVTETHATHPPLMWYRSPQAQRSWVTALLAMLDAGALHLATQPLSAPAEARPFMRMGYVCLRQLAKVTGVPVDDDPKPDDPIRLTRDDFDAALHHLEHAGWAMERDADEAWMHFRGWRVNYEAAAYALADAVNAPPALWSGPRRNLPGEAPMPERPPHRAPSVEAESLREVTRRRRAGRGAPPAPRPHRHDDDGGHADDAASAQAPDSPRSR